MPFSSAMAMLRMLMESQNLSSSPPTSDKKRKRGIDRKASLAELNLHSHIISLIVSRIPR